MVPSDPESGPMRRMFETKSHSWREVGLARELGKRAIRRARRELLAVSLLLAAVLVLYSYRDDVFGRHYDRPVRITTAIALLILGWALARDVGRAMAPALFRRMDPATAGTVGFVIRLFTMVLALLVALRIAGLDPRTLAVGGAFTAVVFGLAAQQTLGNVIAGTVLLSARPFRVGDRVRVHSGPLGGHLDGVVSSLGLLYTVLTRGDDTVMIPNSIVLAAAISPIREPDAVDLRARLPAEVTPSELQELLEERVQTPMRSNPHIALEEVDGDEVVVRISASPLVPAEGARLADEILAAAASLARSDGGGAAWHAPAIDGDP